MKPKKWLIAVICLIMAAAWWGSAQPRPQYFPPITDKLTFKQALEKVHFGLNPWLIRQLQHTQFVKAPAPDELPRFSIEQIIGNKNYEYLTAPATEIDAAYIVRPRNGEPMWMVTFMDVHYVHSAAAGLNQPPPLAKLIQALISSPPRRYAIILFVNADSGKIIANQQISGPYQ